MDAKQFIQDSRLHADPRDVGGGAYGDGSTGDDLAVTGTTNLAADALYDSVTVYSGGILDTKGFDLRAWKYIHVRSGGIVRNKGSAGLTDGTLGAAAPAGSFGGGGAGGAGQTDDVGLPGANLDHSLAAGAGGAGGAGLGGTKAGGAGGTTTAPTAADGTMRAAPMCSTGYLKSGSQLTGGAGGGAGGGTTAKKGAGGGGGGGVLHMAAPLIINDGTVDVSGGAGGAGQASCGGGGGGCGGTIITQADTLCGQTGTWNVAGGAGGAKGTGTGCVAGAVGSAGVRIHVPN